MKCRVCGNWCEVDICLTCWVREGAQFYEDSWEEGV